MRAIQPDAAQWATLPADEWIRLGADFESASFNSRVTRGDLVEAGDGNYRFSLGCALVMLARTWSVWVPSMRAMDGDKAAPGQGAPATGADPMLGQIETYERETQDRRTARWSRGATWLLFLATAAVAAVSFGLSMDVGTLGVLLAVLLFHELGHFAAMRWAGYKDLKIFFLPFIGAAVTGRHEQPTMWQELIVLFAGPVPGLVMGLGALLGWPADSPMPEWVRNCALLAVVINAFNLLPIHTLDGGKIFEILLLSRWPWIAFAGRVAGLLALVGIALVIDDTLGRAALLGLVVLLALGVGHQFREARMAGALRAAGQWGGMTRQAALQALFATIGRLGYGSKPWPTQRALVDAVLPAVIRPRLPRAARMAGLAVYGFLLTLPVLAALAYLWNIVLAPAEN
jgi:Zn-dependent protease